MPLTDKQEREIAGALRDIDRGADRRHPQIEGHRNAPNKGSR